MKYAIVEHSGKQYLAQEGGTMEMDRLLLEVGKPIVFKEVLLVTDGKKVEVGAPFVKGATVKGKVVEHSKGKKVVVFKYKPKERYRRKQGHRRLLTQVSIENIGLTKPKPKPKAKAESKRQTKASRKPAATKRKAASTKTRTTRKAKAAGGAAKKTKTKTGEK